MMKPLLAGVILLGIAGAIAGCGGSDSKPRATPAASAAAPTKAAAAGATPAVAATPAATKASASPSAAAPTSTPSGGGSGGDTCSYLSASDAAVLLPNAGAPMVTSTDNPAINQTTCLWGTATTDRITLVVYVHKLGIPDALKSGIDARIIEKISGLGEFGGFATKGPDAVSITFIKGDVQVVLGVTATGVKADAVAAAAKKIAGGL
jgi:hypothetical protein